MTNPDFHPEQHRPLSAELVYNLGLTAVQTGKHRQATPDRAVNEAKQALQDSMDLREQGHADV